MNNIDDITQKIGETLAKLASHETNEYDTIARVFPILQEMFNLVGTLYDAPTLQAWKEADENHPSYGRFASQLKKSLERQREYLDSISGILLLEGTPNAKKIAVCQEQISTLLERENSLLKDLEPLLEKESELRQQSQIVGDLLRQKEEILEIERKIFGVDIPALTNENHEKEGTISDYERRYKPLLERRDILKAKVAELEQAINHISDEIDQLQTASDNDCARLSDSIPEWVQKLKDQSVNRIDRDKECLEELGKAAEKMRAEEKDIQEHLQLFRNHFEGNAMLKDRFLKTLPNMRTQIADLAFTIEESLTEYDEKLKDMHSKIEEVNNKIQQSYFGD